MKLNQKLLKRLFMIDHTSGLEHHMISYILNYCYKIPHITIETDRERNLFITKNTTNPDAYPCVVAHMDGVNLFMGARELVQTGDIITARYITSGLQCGLNADDSCGICCALQLLEAIPDLKVLFTTQEESGGQGATHACTNVEFFKDVQYCLQADRRGSSDLITHTNGIQSADDNFVIDISDIMDKYGYNEAVGTFTDIGIIAEELLISGVNISCSYLNEHTRTESCNVKWLANCLNFMYEIIITLKGNEKFYTVPEQHKPNYSYLWDSSPKEELPCDHCTGQDCMKCTVYNDWPY